MDDAVMNRRTGHEPTKGCSTIGPLADECHGSLWVSPSLSLKYTRMSEAEQFTRSEEGAAPAWKDMQQRLGRTASSVATTVPPGPRG